MEVDMGQDEKPQEIAFRGLAAPIARMMQDKRADPLLKEMGGLILQRDRCHARIQQVVAELDQLERSYGAAAEVEQMVRGQGQAEDSQ
jgi:hypothetical protein